MHEGDTAYRYDNRDSLVAEYLNGYSVMQKIGASTYYYERDERGYVTKSTFISKGEKKAIRFVREYQNGLPSRKKRFDKKGELTVYEYTYEKYN